MRKECRCATTLRFVLKYKLEIVRAYRVKIVVSILRNRCFDKETKVIFRGGETSLGSKAENGVYFGAFLVPFNPHGCSRALHLIDILN